MLSTKTTPKTTTAINKVEEKSRGEKNVCKNSMAWHEYNVSVALKFHIKGKRITESHLH